MSVFTGGPYGKLSVMLNALYSLHIEIIIIIIIKKDDRVGIGTYTDVKKKRIIENVA